MTIIATASTLEKIQNFIERYYHGPKTLIQTSATEYLIEGCKNGEPYIHENDRVIVKRRSYKHVML